MLGFLAALVMCFVMSQIYAWIIYWMDRYEKEPKLLVGAVFLWGAVVSIIGALVVEILLGYGYDFFNPSNQLKDLLEGSISAPLAEEFFKALGVLGVFLIFRHEFDSIMDGIVYASVVALGFAFTENVLYLSSAFNEDGWTGMLTLFVLRVLIQPWGHALYTSFFGIGLAIARMNRNILIKILAPLVGLGLGMFTHGLSNGILTVIQGIEALALSTLLESAGWFVIFGLMIIVVYQEGKRIQKYLAEEVNYGLISPAQLRTASSTFRQFIAGFHGLFSGNLGNTRRFYQLCGELAHKKYQYHRLGNEGGNLRTIDRLRTELAVLAPYVKA
ncbi:MAG TPA: PrsW family intramembrane metalloprotease [Anaerolineaceae bacterium]